MANVAVLTRWGLFLMGVILLFVGLGIASESVTFGWFGSPPPEGAFVRLPWTLANMQGGGVLVLGSGIALIAGSMGFLFGSRARRSE